MSDVLIKCFKCGKSYPSGDMRFRSSNNNDLICKYCLNKNVTPSNVHTEIIHNPSQVKNTGYTLPKNRETTKVNEKIIEYKCKKCGYSFKRKESVNVNKCPYCGSEKDLQMKSSKSANSLIEESDRI